MKKIRLVYFVDTTLAVLTIISLLYRNSLALWFAVPALIILLIELFFDKSRKREHALDFLIPVMALIVLYECFYKYL